MNPRFRRPTKRQYILGATALVIIAIYGGDFWLGTCGGGGCPTAADIRSFHPDEGGRVLDRSGAFMSRLAVVRRVNVPLSAVPVAVRQAFIATEDRRFYDHSGIDWRGLLRASLRNIRAGGVREGFSTITMQVVRNTFVVRRFRGRSFKQKLIEMRLSRLLERNLTKDQILELYLNVIYLGNGVYGVEAASRDLFGKSVSDLTVPEGAVLAALPKGPSAYTPRRSPRRALARRNLVLGLMAQEGYITPAAAATYANVPLRVARDEWRPDMSGDSYAIDAVRDVVDSVLKSGSLDVNDLTVYTTLDTRAQNSADRAVRRQAAVIQQESGDRRGTHVEGAMVALDPRTGDVRALVGGRRFERGSFDRALLAHRQPGSAFKPFVYATALAAGYTPASEVDDEPISVRIGRTVWSPKNYGGEYGGHVTFRRALMRSENAATVRVSEMVGIPAIIATAHRFGIQSDLPDVPSAALGALEVTPMELATAYAPFANGGWRVTPRLVRRVQTADGTVLWSSDNQRAHVMDPRDAYQLTSMLQGVVNYGTGNVIRDLGVEGLVAGKTGTTNDGTDVWFMGYTPTLVAGFWFGYDTPRPIGYNASGGTLAAPAWADFYMNGWDEPNPPGAWLPPAGMAPAVIDARTGYLATEWCPVTMKEYFKPGTLPTTPCPVHSAPPEPAIDTTPSPVQEVPQVVEKIGRGIGGFFKRIFKRP
ncbi:MAG: PBP1A family penicillin-binding protein [Gemmatimonadota bacterium]|nr:PBP1A family penicillin-binding protein [Gemmatimonadota bacterium]